MRTTLKTTSVGKKAPLQTIESQREGNLASGTLSVTNLKTKKKNLG